MYGLKKAPILAHYNLVKNIQINGCKHILHTLGFCKHKTKQITFCLCIDDFVFFFNKSDENHLLQSLQKNYTATVDWSGKILFGIIFDWKYHNGCVDVSCSKITSTVSASTTKTTQISPFAAAPYVKYIKVQRQYEPKNDSFSLLPPDEITMMKQIIISFFYSDRAINNTLLPYLNTNDAKQATVTKKRKSNVIWYLNTLV